MTFERFESAGYLANHMARLFAQGLAERIGPLGLSPGQFPLLLVLWAHDGLTQRQLVDAIDVEQATISNTLARMERDGLIVRRPHAEDGRAQAIFLTARAKMLEAPATAAATAQNELALSLLSGEERLAFNAMMLKVIAAMQRNDVVPLQPRSR